MQPDTVTQFQEDIFGGRWDAALKLLPKLTFDTDVALQASGRRMSSPCQNDLDWMRMCHAMLLRSEVLLEVAVWLD